MSIDETREDDLVACIDHGVKSLCEFAAFADSLDQRIFYKNSTIIDNPVDLTERDDRPVLYE
jgi:hypothetical protein